MPGAASGASGNQKKAMQSPPPQSKKKCCPMPRGRLIVFTSGMPSTLRVEVDGSRHVLADEREVVDPSQLELRVRLGRQHLGLRCCLCVHVGSSRSSPITTGSRPPREGNCTSRRRSSVAGSIERLGGQCRLPAWARSTSVTTRPARARSIAVAAPAARVPTTTSLWRMRIRVPMPGDGRPACRGPDGRRAPA